MKSINMSEYANVLKHQGSISVIFNIEHNKVFTIGEKVNKINELAYMNGQSYILSN